MSGFLWREDQLEVFPFRIWNPSSNASRSYRMLGQKSMLIISINHWFCPLMPSIPQPISASSLN